MIRVHITALMSVLTNPVILSLPAGYQVLAAHHDERTYTLLLRTGSVTELATGRLTPAGPDRFTLTPPMLERDGLAHGRIPLAFLPMLPPESEVAADLEQVEDAAPKAGLTQLHWAVRHARHRHDPHRPVRMARERALRRAQAFADLACGNLTLNGRTFGVTRTPAGLLLDDGRVLHPDVLDTL